jgi:hypothetical protein
MGRIIRNCTIAAIIAAMTSGAFAQAAPPGGKPCSSGTANGNLSNNLQGSQGVICPPNVDPGMKAPAPQTGDRPAIPPPANPGVQPK